MSEWPPEDLESTANLLRRAQEGDIGARDRLFRRYYPRLTAIAHGKLAPRHRRMYDTEDLVQRTLLNAFGRLEYFKYQGEHSYMGYLCRALRNEILQIARKHPPTRAHDGLSDDYLDPGETPFEVVARLEMFERYQEALNRLSEEKRRAVVMRIEYYSYQEIADAIGRRTANAARMFVVRAVAEMAKHMRASGIGRQGHDGT